MSREFCYGDRVWSPLFGWGTVTRGGRSGEVVVSADVQPSAHWAFLPCGHQGLINGKLEGQPLLFHEEMQYSPKWPSGRPPTCPDVELVEDAPVWVLVRPVEACQASDDEQESSRWRSRWEKRHFCEKARWQAGIYIWCGGRTSHTADLDSDLPTAHYDIWAPFDPTADKPTQVKQWGNAVGFGEDDDQLEPFIAYIDNVLKKLAADALSKCASPKSTTTFNRT